MEYRQKNRTYCSKNTFSTQKTKYDRHKKHPSLTPCHFMQNITAIKRNNRSPWMFTCLFENQPVPNDGNSQYKNRKEHNHPDYHTGQFRYDIWIKIHSNTSFRYVSIVSVRSRIGKNTDHSIRCHQNILSSNTKNCNVPFFIRIDIGNMPCKKSLYGFIRGMMIE